MKLLQISSMVNIGSVGRIAEQIGQRALAKGWESYIAYGRASAPSESKTIKIGGKCDLISHGILTRITDRHALGSQRATLQLIKEIEQIAPDIIQLHNLHGYFINIKILFQYLAQVHTPVVWIFHDCWSFTGHCVYFDYVGCKKWKKGCFSCPQKREYPASYLMDSSKYNYYKKRELFTSVNNMTIVPVSNWLSDIVKQSFFNIYPINVIQNGIDIDIFKPSSNTADVRKKYGAENKFLILGVASPWSHRKGLHYFIELSKLLTEDYQILLVGLNASQIKNLPKNIIGLERTENVQKLAELYSTADVFFNPTLEDTFPTTNLEAQACGTPVITFNSGGSPEMISTKTGIVVNKGHIKGALKAIYEIRQKGKCFYTKNCRKRIVDNFNKENKFNEYIDLYEQLLNPKK